MYCYDFILHAVADIASLRWKISFKTYFSVKFHFDVCNAVAFDDSNVCLLDTYKIYKKVFTNVKITFIRNRLMARDNSISSKSWEMFIIAHTLID